MLLTPPLTAGTTRGTITTAIAAKTGTRREVFPVQPDEDARKTYRAVVTRDGGFWSVRVPEISRTTQARTLAEIEPMARDLIAVMEDIPADSFGLEISGDEGFEAAVKAS